VPDGKTNALPPEQMSIPEHLLFKAEMDSIRFLERGGLKNENQSPPVVDN